MRITWFPRPRESGEVVTIPHGALFRLECCDCHLVHDLDIKIEGVEYGKGVKIKLVRNNHATAARRRSTKRK